MSANIKNIFKIKNNFLNLLAKNIEEINKTINDINKAKLYINITTKKPSHRQIIIPMGDDNIYKFMTFSGRHVINMNRALKGIKSKIIVDFIYNNYQGLIIAANKVVSQSDI